MMKKIICTVAMLALCLSAIWFPNDYDSYAAEISTKDVKSIKALKVLNDEEYVSIESNKVSPESLAAAEKKVLNKADAAVLYYNNGEPLDVSEIVTYEEDNDPSMNNSEAIRKADEEQLRQECEAAGYDYVNDGYRSVKTSVFGVYVYKSGLGDAERVILSSNGETMNVSEIQDSIKASIENADKYRASVSTLATNQTNYKHYDETVTYKEGNVTVARLVRNLHIKEYGNKATHNSKDAKMWDVEAVIQVETFEGRRIVNKYVWLNTNKSGQHLSDYTPMGDTGGMTSYNLSFSANGPNPSLSVNMGGTYSRTDMSSITGKYGKWKYYTSTGLMKKKLTTKSAIKTVCTSNSVVFKDKAEITVKHLVGKAYHSTTYTFGPSTWTFKNNI